MSQSTPDAPRDPSGAPTAAPDTTGESLGLPLLHAGKVRRLYDLPNSRAGQGQMLMVATDAISAYDHVLTPAIADKGIILNQLSMWWFGQLADLVPNHVISTQVPDQVAGRAVVCEKLTMIPVECVARGYLTGSGWLEYQESGTVCGIPLPEGLVDGSRLPEPIFTPATKAPMGEHDQNIDFDTMVRIIGPQLSEAIRDLTLAVYKRAEQIARDRGIILADTKLEFGLRPDGTIVLADEVLTPDSSRFWDSESSQPGGNLASFDKQFVRNWLTDESGWNRDSDEAPPELPEKVVDATRQRYLVAYELLTGKDSFAMVEAAHRPRVTEPGDAAAAAEEQPQLQATPASPLEDTADQAAEATDEPTGEVDGDARGEAAEATEQSPAVELAEAAESVQPDPTQSTGPGEGEAAADDDHGVDEHAADDDRTADGDRVEGDPEAGTSAEDERAASAAPESLDPSTTRWAVDSEAAAVSLTGVAVIEAEGDEGQADEAQGDEARGDETQGDGQQPDPEAASDSENDDPENDDPENDDPENDDPENDDTEGAAVGEAPTQDDPNQADQTPSMPEDRDAEARQGHDSPDATGEATEQSPDVAEAAPTEGQPAEGEPADESDPGAHNDPAAEDDHGDTDPAGGDQGTDEHSGVQGEVDEDTQRPTEDAEGEPATDPDGQASEHSEDDRAAAASTEVDEDGSAEGTESADGAEDADGHEGGRTGLAATGAAVAAAGVVHGGRDSDHGDATDADAHAAAEAEDHGASVEPDGAADDTSPGSSGDSDAADLDRPDAVDVAEAATVADEAEADGGHQDAVGPDRGQDNGGTADAEASASEAGTPATARVTTSRIIVDVMPKPEILDPQGKAVTGALKRMGHQGLSVRQGKRFEIEVEGEITPERLAEVREAAETLLANTVIEAFDVRVEEA